MQIKTDHTYDFSDADMLRAAWLLIKEINPDHAPAKPEALTIRWIAKGKARVSFSEGEVAPAAPPLQQAQGQMPGTQLHRSQS